jgi:hypothetical protein
LSPLAGTWPTRNLFGCSGSSFSGRQRMHCRWESWSSPMGGERTLEEAHSLSLRL